MARNKGYWIWSVVAATVFLIFLAVILGFTIDTNNKTASQQPPPSPNLNMYVFGASYEETGNWRIAITNGDFPNRTLPLGPLDPITPPTTFYGPPLNSPGIALMGSRNRFSDGWNYLDFIAQTFGFHLTNSLSLGALPNGVNNLVNFAVAGASAEGNVFNTIIPNSDYNQLLGPHSVIAQVQEFIALKSVPGSAPITANDIFLIGTLSGNDISTIGAMAYNGNASGIPAAIASSIGTYLYAIQALYNMGARRMVITTVEGPCYPYIPSIWKTDYTGSVLASTVGLVNQYFTFFYAQVAILRSTTALDLELEVTSICDLPNVWASEPFASGARATIESDLGDPRVTYGGAPLPLYPFPTLYDMSLPPYNINGKSYNFHDDLHPTQIIHKRLSQVLGARLEAYLIN